MDASDLIGVKFTPEWRDKKYTSDSGNDFKADIIPLDFDYRTATCLWQTGNAKAKMISNRQLLLSGRGFSFHLPAIFVQVDAAVIVNFHPFPSQKAPLFKKPTAQRQRDPAVSANHSLPGQPVFFGLGMEDPGYLARSPRLAGQMGDLAVRGYFSAWNGRDQSTNRRAERIGTGRKASGPMRQAFPQGA
jgi:hypothetical protein